MGISRDSRHKHRLTGGKRAIHQKKRKAELGRPAASTKLGGTLVRPVRCRAGIIKHRALRLDSGNYCWATENVSRKVRIVGVVYNASNNELVRTNTIVKNCIVLIDAQPFKQWYQKYYGADFGKASTSEEHKDEEKISGHVKAVRAYRSAHQKLDPLLEEQFASGRLLACVSSRPGQVGAADGYILEGKELEFYKKKLDKKKK